MKFTPQRPSKRDELIGQLAAVAMGIMLAVPATYLVKFAVSVFRDPAPGGHRGGGFAFYAILLAAFLYLVAGSIVGLTFLPKDNGRGRTVRGFGLVSALFDGFFAIVGAVFRTRRW